MYIHDSNCLVAYWRQVYLPNRYLLIMEDSTYSVRQTFSSLDLALAFHQFSIMRLLGRKLRLKQPRCSKHEQNHQIGQIKQVIRRQCLIQIQEVSMSFPLQLRVELAAMDSLTLYIYIIAKPWECKIPQISIQFLSSFVVFSASSE